VVTTTSIDNHKLCQKSRDAWSIVIIQKKVATNRSTAITKCLHSKVLLMGILSNFKFKVNDDESC